MAAGQIGGRDPIGIKGVSSRQHPLLAFGDITLPLQITGPSAEFDMGFLARDGKTVKFDAVVCLDAAPSNAANYVTCTKGSKPNTVLVSVWKNTFAAADAATVTNIHLVAMRGGQFVK